MAEIESKKPETGPGSSEDISLDEIDSILAADDPEFTSSLSEIQSVGAESDVEIISSVPGEDDFGETPVEPVESDARFPKLKKVVARLKLVRPFIKRKVHSLRTPAIALLRLILHGARTYPIEFLKYSKAMSKVILAAFKKGIEWFRALPLRRKIPLLLFLMLFVAFSILLSSNLKGIWLPRIYQPLLTDFSKVADKTFQYDPKTDTEKFLEVFPQEQFGYLFRKVVVNLRRTSAQNPMGAFEFYIDLDSKDTAVEVQARENELLDTLQRAIEEQSYSELDSRLGKKRLKDIIARELNALLTQGWVKGVYIKTFILKP